jgi:FMN phosphatase YigB (HAD superfamily)
MQQTLNLSDVRAVTLDLDDTLWPIWPTITRAEAVLARWLAEHAPQTAALYASVETRLALRDEAVQALAGQAHDMSALRRESIRLALLRAGEDPTLAVPAFEVFFTERHRVELYADVLESLAFLSARFPLVALSNGNADLQRVGRPPRCCTWATTRRWTCWARMPWACRRHGSTAARTRGRTRCSRT